MTPSSTTGLYRPEYEHGSCGIGMVARTDATDSHETVRLALDAVARLEHRGAVGADGNSSDGAGLLTTLPLRFLRDELAAQDVIPPSSVRLGVGMVFLPTRPTHTAERARAILSEELARAGARVYAWRVVPLDKTAVGDAARSVMPRIEQVVFGFEPGPGTIDPASLERVLFIARRRTEKRFAAEGAASAYICSLSTRTVVYKGLVLSTRIARLFPDLADVRYEARAAVFHQRFSTNTFPSWPLAQPLRSIAHNGEFNTLRGNLSWLAARERTMRSRLLGDALPDVLPVVQPGDSDSASFDRLFELMVHAGRDPSRVLSMLMPSADHPRADDDVRAMYEYHSRVAETWDGPAAMVATDGRVAVAALDRNGLRPMRYQITRDGWLCVASETGLLGTDGGLVIESDRLGPGRMLEVDLVRGGVRNDVAIETALAGRHPFREWMGVGRTARADGWADGVEPAESGVPAIRGGELLRAQVLFGWDREDLERMVVPMAESGAVPVGSMGDDSAIAPLSSVGQPITRFFRQRFAQVTNPPLDPIRERCMFSLETPLGRHSNMLEDGVEAVEQTSFASPTINERQFQRVVALCGGGTVQAGVCVLDATFDAGAGALESRVAALAAHGARAASEGARLLVLTDRAALANGRAPVPMLLVVSAVHHALIEAGQRLSCSIVCETGEARDDHDIACLLGYGATLVFPYLALATVREAFGEDADGAVARYIGSADAGLLKAMSRMGVSVLRSYRGAQLFETLGLDRSFVQAWFPGTVAPIGGYDASYFESQAGHALRAASGPEPLTERGRYRFRNKGEAHGFAPLTFTALHKAVRTGNPEAYAAYTKTVSSREPVSIRDLLEFVPAGKPVPLGEVESVAKIVTRFVTGAMSHGSLSREAHEVMAVATNRIGARSNSGEGGEDPERSAPYSKQRGPSSYHSDWKPGAGDWGSSSIKQVASGRFGVTAAYLATAGEIEIKMAQGAKPGEGGQIPGFKVSVEIGRLRGAAAGTTLISPPPHHDIYSIEDLAELIHDLKSVNPRARVAVKLVSTSGVGTIAAGVVKAHADVVQISGHEGGTGASPLSALKHAGMPWELGLAETRQTLLLNGLRSRVRLRVDGGLRTGRDVAVAAALGADEYGFGTVALVAAGCVMARKCHLNTCPVGIATQDPVLRAKFPGQPEHVIAFFTFVAEELRHLLASLGLRKISELVGRADLLRATTLAQERFELDQLLASIAAPIRRREARNDRANPSGSLDDQILADASHRIDAGVPLRRSYRVCNSDRAVGAGIAGEIGRIHGPAGLPADTFQFDLAGTAGQSLGAFCVPGLQLVLTGEAQDYVGKSMSGGRIVIRPGASGPATGHDGRPPVVMGNTVLYGASGGELLAAGRAGERFAVRNSGTTAVIEGCGEHGCEYMTGGTVLILGSVGRNFGAGMTGGRAFVLNPGPTLGSYLCLDSVEAVDVAVDSDDAERVRELLRRFAEWTGSSRAKRLGDAWAQSEVSFLRIQPRQATREPAVINVKRPEAVRSSNATSAR